MKCPKYSEAWPELWKEEFRYDLLEIYGSKKDKPYTYAYKNRFNNLVKMIKRWLPGGATILDVGAAQGNFTLILAEAGYKVTWNDLRQDLVDYVKLKYEYGHVEFLPGNIFEIKDQQYDGVIISEIIEHVAYPDQFLQNVAVLVKPKGFIFLSTPLGNYMLNKLPRFSDFPDPAVFEQHQFKPNSDGHIFLMYEDELITLSKKIGLIVKEYVVQNNFFTSGHLKTRVFQKIMPEKFVEFIESYTQKLPKKLRLKIHSNILMVFQKA